MEPARDVRFLLLRERRRLTLMSTPKRRVLVVGGVAGGASCAARLRRMDESAEIVMFDRGPFVSFANCGLPYHVGDIIPRESQLVLASPELFRDRFNIDVRVRHEVMSIDRAARTVDVRDLVSGAVSRERYDALVLAPGASAIRPPLPGIDLPGVFIVRTIPDAQAIREWIVSRNAKRAVVIGGGFIGLEMAENLVHRGLSVTIVEKLHQVMPPMDPEVAWPVAECLQTHGVVLGLGDGLAGFRAQADGSLMVDTESGAAHPADLVILAIGVRPENGLAKAAGLELGARGGIAVDAQMRTSDPNIWAVGDAVEVTDVVLAQQTLIPLAGPANRQGRVAADAICGRNVAFRGVQGTAVCGLFDLAIASTGASEKALKRAGLTDYGVVYLHPAHHVGYYPGAETIHLKLVFGKSDGRILGAQAVGAAGVDKRIDVIAMALQKGGTVFDLEEAELCYAPQFGAAKDPVNLAGMIAANALRGDLELVPWEQLGRDGALVLDVRDPDEFEAGHIPGARNLPLHELRARLGELPRDTAIQAYCKVGQRAYNAVRLLAQHGFRAGDLSGGYLTYVARVGAGLG